MKQKANRSPLKEPPLRLPGQSVDEQMRWLFGDKLVSYVLFALAFFILASFSWIQAINRSQVNPWIMTIIALPVIVYCAIRTHLTLRELKKLRLAREGEIAVAEKLDGIKKQGAAVFHDVVGDGFNIDHVVLSSRGIFVIETKTRSKPVKGSPSVTFDGNKLLVNGFEPERNPVNQVIANAKWLREVLRASTGKEFPVKPVVLFPGWFVEPFPKGSLVWVLNPDVLSSFIQHEPIRIMESDLHMAAFHLARYIRAHALGFKPRNV